MSKPVYLVDASIYIFQAYFSPHLQVWALDGRDLSAFFGYAQFLLRFLRQARGRLIQGRRAAVLWPPEATVGVVTM